MSAAGLAPSVSATGNVRRGSIATALLDVDGFLLVSEPVGVVFPAAALTALQHAIEILSPATQFIVLLPNHRVEASRLANGKLLVNLIPGRGDTQVQENATGPILDSVAWPSRLPELKRPLPSTDAQIPAEPPRPQPAGRPAVVQPTLQKPTKPAPAVIQADVRPVPFSESLAVGSPAPDSPTRVESLEQVQRPEVTRRRRRAWMAIAAAAIVLLAVGGSAFWGSTSLGSHRPIVERQPTPSSGVLGIQANAPQPTATTGSASPAPAAVSLTYTGDLAHGSSGDAVRALQARLRQLHYYDYPADTGYFGDATFGAVSTFQQARGLPATGVADRATIAALNACDQSCVY